MGNREHTENKESQIITSIDKISEWIQCNVIHLDFTKEFYIIAHQMVH